MMKADVEMGCPSPKSASETRLYQFHNSNIQEKRPAAYIARAMPMLILLALAVLSFVGVFWYPVLLLAITAIFNVWFWLWLVSYGTYAMAANWMSKHTLDSLPAANLELDAVDERDTASVVHLVVLPNYKEDISILATTLEALTEAQHSRKFRVVLAMEAREGKQAEDVAQQLQTRYGSCFAKMSAVFHPSDLRQLHLDGSVNAEVPGKSSNLKWAVQMSLDDCRRDGLSVDKVVLTVADADCIFHPSYFFMVGDEYTKLSEVSGSQHLWTMWQAPQLLFRNYYASSTPSRIWAYISGLYEFGGSALLKIGGQHMTFSSFSIPLALFEKASPWEGDVIADDHHCFLKCFLYSIWQQVAGAENECSGGLPTLQVRPVMLPVKSTSVVAENCCRSWKARFNQAKRHSQGVAELSYAIMGTWDLLCTLPRTAYSCKLFYRLCRVLLVPFCINMLPILQSVPFAVLSIYWIINGQTVPECEPHWLQYRNPRFYLCVCSGGWNLGVPVVIPMMLITFVSYCSISSFFLSPAAKLKARRASKDQRSTVWDREDAGIRPLLGSKRLTLICLVVLDCVVLLAPVMAIYGAIPAVLAYWNCLVRGNQFKFKSAAKVVKTPAPSLNSVKIKDIYATSGSLEEIDGDIHSI